MNRVISRLNILRKADTPYKVAILKEDASILITGMKAAEWLQIKPSTYGDIAYGIAYVLIKEDYYDREFVAQHTSGFDEWKDYVLKEFYPTRTSQITGIPVEQILRISIEFGYTKPALALSNHNASDSSNGLFNVLAVHSLNALAGNFEKPEGYS